MIRPATLKECRTCGLPIITGTDDYRLPVIADLRALSRFGEILAMAAGLDCWRLDGERRLWRTDQWRILSDCPLPGDHRVTAHTCEPIPADWTTPTPQPAAKATDERCPF